MKTQILSVIVVAAVACLSVSCGTTGPHGNINAGVTGSVLDPKDVKFNLGGGIQFAKKPKKTTEFRTESGKQEIWKAGTQDWLFSYVFLSGKDKGGTGWDLERAATYEQALAQYRSFRVKTRLIEVEWFDPVGERLVPVDDPRGPVRVQRKG